MKNLTFIFSLVLYSFINAQTGSQSGEFTLVADGLQFPEGPAWNGSELVFSNCYSHWIGRVNGNISDTLLSSPTAPYNFGKTNGLTFSKDGALYACDYGNGAIVRFTPEGKCELVSNGWNNTRFSRPNDLAFDKKGNIYFTDPLSYDPENRDGRIFMIPAGSSKAVLMYKGLAFPNGIAFSPDGSSIYVCESAMQRILRFELDDKGRLIDPEIFAEMPGGDPDGLAFDIEGNLYAAHFGGGRIAVFSPAGKLIREIKTPGSKPSNVEFGGSNMKTLFITEDETNAVYKIEMPVKGLILFNSPLK